MAALTSRTMKTILTATVCSAALALSSTFAMSKAPDIKPFGKLKDGREASLITLENKHGASVQISNFGGIIVSFNVPDKAGKLDSIVLGKDTLAEYEAGHPFFGCITGRYANRIAKGKFTLDGKEYKLHVNNGPNSLHGGKEGFDKKLWALAGSGEKDGAGFVTLSYTSPDGEEGYPGTLKCEVTYSFSDDNALRIEYKATTDKPTVVNLTNHSYFNLAGHGNGNVLDHVAQLHCPQYTDSDAELIPNGQIKNVAGTPLDFLKPVRIGDRIDQTDFAPLKYGAGYDHNFIIEGKPGTLRPAAKVTDPKSGRTLECLTTEPAVQLYTGNHMDEKGTKGRGGRTYPFRGGFCLETQHYPDSPNHPSFPSTVLKPGGTYQHVCVYKAGVVK
jgi:aldose 1-epimerase